MSSWQDKALCPEVDPEIFYPEKGGSLRPAQLICHRCEVRLECLQDALDRREDFGVWGGMGPRERLRLRRRNRRAA